VRREAERVASDRAKVDDPTHPAREPIEGISFLAYRRIATVILLPLTHGGPGSFQAVTVTPQEIEAAQASEGQAR
jgi:hypothetical protein